MWRCPECKAEFKNQSQWHSCLRKDIQSHFKGKPDDFVLIFDEIVKVLEKLGDFSLRSVSSAIIFKRASGFAAIKTQKAALVFEWMTNRLIDDDERILKTLQVSKNRWAHIVKIARKAEFDASLKQYLREAYKVCAAE